MRGVRVLSGVLLLTVAGVLVLPWTIGGKIGTAILCAFLFVVLRNAIRLIAFGPFTLDGRPLPVLFFFVPSPTYPGPNPTLILVGAAALGAGILVAGQVGWVLAAQSHFPAVQFMWLPPTLLVDRAVGSLIIGVVYAALIVGTEKFRKPSTRRHGEPWLTIGLALGMSILSAVAMGGA